MVNVISQNGEVVWSIEYFHLAANEAIGGYDMVALARIDLEETKLVDLGHYTFWKQAIEVFASLDYCDNDLMYYKKNPKLFQMPGDITDPQECIRVYGNLY